MTVLAAVGADVAARLAANDYNAGLDRRLLDLEFLLTARVDAALATVDGPLSPIERSFRDVDLIAPAS